MVLRSALFIFNTRLINEIENVSTRQKSFHKNNAIRALQFLTDRFLFVWRLNARHAPKAYIDSLLCASLRVLMVCNAMSFVASMRQQFSRRRRIIWCLVLLFEPFLSLQKMKFAYDQFMVSSDQF